ncbi:MAG TPA: N-dimethylarginine dimethylaminohydrolase [Propionibacteriaceae bacterium]|nr:N-dimethylarginine dimethylaminohydrolase [Propionibacteriaceae bacterium]
MTIVEDRETLLDVEMDVSGERVPSPKTVLMCRPEHFTVRYRINPWMEPANPTDTGVALRQWQSLYEMYRRLGYRIELIDPIAGLPDMVYAANGGFVLDGIAYGARFHYAERGPEGPAYAAWFAERGLRVVEPVSVNEGEGDFLKVGDTIFAGTGFRSDAASHAELSRIYDREVVTLRLVDPSFYHLDTAFAVLDDAGGPASVAYLPRAFDEASRELLERRFPDAVLATDADAAVLGLNSFSDGRNVVIASRARSFARDLEARGYVPHGVDLSELLLGGGGVKCCTLELRW